MRFAEKGGYGNTSKRLCRFRRIAEVAQLLWVSLATAALSKCPANSHHPRPPHFLAAEADAPTHPQSAAQWLAVCTACAPAAQACCRG